MNRLELERRARLWRRHRALRTALFSIAGGLASGSGVVRVSLAGAAFAAATISCAIWIALRRRSRPVTAAIVAAHLDRLCPALEESASLWLRDPATFNLIERLQQRRLDAAWASLPDRATLGCPPVRDLQAPLATVALAACSLILFLAWPAPPAAAPARLTLAPIAATPPPAVAPTLRTGSITVKPPAYLGQPTRHIEGLDAEIAEGSAVAWDLTFAGDVAGVSLIGAGAHDPLVAEPVGGGRFRAETVIADTRLYQLESTRRDGTRTLWPHVHTLKAIRDQPPRLTWQEPAASRTVIAPAGGLAVTVRLAASDDHALADVHLVMTIAKGSGEAVKFREQPVALDRRPDPAGGELFSRTLDLVTLGLEPGDELYFHALATDNRAPAPNVTRSETRFVVLRGPPTELAEPGTAIAGINLVPQYFRSQRQLIIDTERLVADRPGLTPEIFRERSEEIGIDQKLLRLRYGQFLGEEFEPDAAGPPREAQGLAFAGRLRGSSADARRAGAIERAVEQQHDHPRAAPRENAPATIEALRAPFVHQHDNAEAATLFDLELKAALRAVLAAMWEAEGFLRTGQPAEALPAENRALDRLKALQQADRVYVRRVGFESAPLKIDERRLRGELDRIPARAQAAVPLPAADPAVDALRRGLALLGATPIESWPPATAAAIEERLTAAAREQPEKFVAALEAWRRRASELSPAGEASLRRALWSLLPPGREAPHRVAEPAPALAREYFEALTGGARTPP